MHAQSGILPPASAYARFLVLRVTTLTSAQLCQALRQFEQSRERLQAEQPQAGLCTVLAFGAAQWQRLGAAAVPGLRVLQPAQGAFVLPAEAGDVLVHIRSERFDLCFELAQELMAALKPHVEVLEDCAAFRYRDSRDLTGFIDGTENPESTAERAEAALLATGPHQGGSFVFSQRYIHNLAKWQQLAVAAQEQVIGRSKADSVEMDDAVKPENAHIARALVEEDGEELDILRHSLPYGEAAGDQGLFFIAYTRDLDIIERMLARMFGLEADGLSDRLLNFVQPVGGAYFYAPAQTELQRILAQA